MIDVFEDTEEFVKEVAKSSEAISLDVQEDNSIRVRSMPSSRGENILQVIKDWATSIIDFCLMPMSRIRVS